MYVLAHFKHFNSSHITPITAASESRFCLSAQQHLHIQLRLMMKVFHGYESFSWVGFSSPPPSKVGWCSLTSLFSTSSGSSPEAMPCYITRRTATMCLLMPQESNRACKLFNAISMVGPLPVLNIAPYNIHKNLISN